MAPATIRRHCAGQLLLVCSIAYVTVSCNGERSTGPRNLRSSQPSFARPAAVTASAGGPYSGDEGTAITFDGTSSSGSGLTYAWDFGDGSKGTGATPTHTYADNKVFTVKLVVTDANGARSTRAQTTATIANVAPVVADLTAPDPAPRAGTVVTLSTTFTDAGTADKHSGTFVWGDGGSSAATKQEAGGSGTMTGTHTYANAGTYDVSLRVKDDDGGADTVTLALVVLEQNRPPTASAGGPYEAGEGAPITFDGSGSSDPDSDAITYAWDFGDAAKDTGVAPQHVYVDNGTYTVKLTVTDTYGAKSTVSQTTATISNAAPKIGSFTAQTGATNATPVTVTATFSDSGTRDPHSATLDWGDGTSGPGSVTESGGSGTVTGTHSYANAGTYTVKLRLTDNGGGSDSATVSFSLAAAGGGDVAVTANSVGRSIDPDGYTVVLDAGTSQAVAANGTTTFSGVSAGAHTLTLTGLASNCSTGFAQQSVTVVDGATTNVTFDVFCIAVGASTYTLIGAGDIADCTRIDDEATAAVLDSLVALEPGAAVYTIGDNVYDMATASDYANCYDPNWGQQKIRTFATLGNHEYKLDPNPTWDYFGTRAGPRGLGYYSYDIGDYWHVIVLNDNASYGGPARTAGSAQDLWLQSDLAANTKPCVIAMWHQPFVASDGWYSSSRKIFWDRLYAAGAEIVLNGHLHTYERMYPQTPDLVRDDANGILQFIVGTGGASTYTPDSLTPNTVVVAPSRGVLKLTLGPGTYSWQFVWAKGQTFTDYGSGTCH